MQKIVAATALAVTLSLSLAPATAFAPTAADGAASHQAPQVQAAVVAAPMLDAAALDAERAEARQRLPHASADIAPGQGRAEFEAWLARRPENRAAVAEFSAYLTRAGVGDVLPAWQLVRTSSSWRQCGADGFEVAPRDKWDNIVRTLRFVKEEVIPAVGPVRALSGYRNQRLNACSNGAPASAHRHFHALDLMPVSAAVSPAAAARMTPVSASTTACASTSTRAASAAGARTAAAPPAPASATADSGQEALVVTAEVSAAAG
jgi:hypothetical protein